MYQRRRKKKRALAGQRAPWRCRCCSANEAIAAKRPRDCGFASGAAKRAVVQRRRGGVAGSPMNEPATGGAEDGRRRRATPSAGSDAGQRDAGWRVPDGASAGARRRGRAAPIKVGIDDLHEDQAPARAACVGHRLPDDESAVYGALSGVGGLQELIVPVPLGFPITIGQEHGRGMSIRTTARGVPTRSRRANIHEAWPADPRCRSIHLSDHVSGLRHAHAAGTP